MASLHKDPRGKSAYWYCAFTLPNGQRAFKSTKLRDRSQAWDFCLKLERASEMAEKGELTESKARGFVQEITKRAKEGTSSLKGLKEAARLQSQAEKLVGEMVTLAGGEELTFRSTKEFCRNWLKAKDATSAGSTAIRYRGIIEGFLAEIGDRKANGNISNVSPHEIQRFRDLEVKKGKSPTTANLSLKTIRSVFNAARRQGLMTSNPAEAIETFKAEKETRDVFTNGQLRQLFAVAPTEWKTMIMLGYYTAARLSDCANMIWKNVHLNGFTDRNGRDHGKVIIFSPRKTSRGQERANQLEIPLMPDLEAHLLTLPSSDDPEAKLCPTLSLKATGGNHGLSANFQRIMAKAGVIGETGQKKHGKGRVFKTLGFHSLRHSFVSELANADVAAEVRQKISGHDSETVHARYTHLEIETKRRAMGKMRGISE